MTDPQKRVIDLPDLAEDIADGDLFIIENVSQVSGQRTSKVTAAQLVNYMADAIPLRQIRYDVSVFVGGGVFDNSELILSHPFALGVTFPAGLGGSQAECSAAPTLPVTLPVKKNGTQIGTISFAAGVTTGTFAMATDQSFVIGDKLEIFAPSGIDITFAKLGITITGSIT